MASMKKKSIVRWVNVDGSRAKPNAPEARKTVEKSAKWYGTFRDADGVKRTVALCKDKAAARMLLAEAERKAQRVAAGLEAADPHGHADRPLAVHLDDHQRTLLAEGSTEQQARQVRFRAGAVLTGCGFRRLADIRPGPVVEIVPTLVIPPKSAKSKPRPLGLQTRNYYLAAAKQFCRWAQRDGRMPNNPLGHLTGWNAAVDVRRQRRALTDAEARRLLDATRTQPERLGLSGEARAMLYAAALGTGLRASELASLTPRSFALDANPPTVAIAAKDEKARRGDVLPIHPGLAAMLAAWIAGRPLDAPLWPGNWARHKCGPPPSYAPT